MPQKIPFLLTVDLEEFDIANEYGQILPWKKQTEITLQGLERLQKVLMELDIRATFFVTSNWAKEFPEKVVELSMHHEIASHACSHSVFNDADYLISKLVLEKISGKNINGFRMPRLSDVDYSKLKSAGYTYDASVNPTWLPKRYNKMTEPIRPYTKSGLLILPSSVTPVLRIPFFWLSFKNLPNFISLLIMKRIVKNKVIIFYVHPWEYADIGYIKLPFYINRRYGVLLAAKLKRFLGKIKNDVDFKTCDEFVKNYRGL